jgi:hypothetical protein
MEKWGGKHVDATRGPMCNPKNLGSKVSQKLYEGHNKKKQVAVERSIREERSK